MDNWLVEIGADPYHHHRVSLFDMVFIGAINFNDQYARSLLLPAAALINRLLDITALYNTSAFWVYCLALRYLNERFSGARIAAVALSVFGVFVIAYGDSLASAAPAGAPESRSSNSKALGNALAMIGSVAYASSVLSPQVVSVIQTYL